MAGGMALEMEPGDRIVFYVTEVGRVAGAAGQVTA